MFQGIGSAILQNSGTALISDMIGTDLDSSAFVYGVFGFFERCTSGFLFYVCISSITDNKEALRIIISLCAPFCAFLIYLCVVIGQKYYGDKLAKITGAEDKESLKEPIK